MISIAPYSKSKSFISHLFSSSIQSEHLRMCSVQIIISPPLTLCLSLTAELVGQQGVGRQSLDCVAYTLSGGGKKKRLKIIRSYSEQQTR